MLNARSVPIVVCLSAAFVISPLWRCLCFFSSQETIEKFKKKVFEFYTQFNSQIQQNKAEWSSKTSFRIESSPQYPGWNFQTLFLNVTHAFRKCFRKCWRDKSLRMLHLKYSNWKLLFRKANTQKFSLLWVSWNGLITCWFFLYI